MSGTRPDFIPTSVSILLPGVTIFHIESVVSRVLRGSFFKTITMNCTEKDRRALKAGAFAPAFLKHLLLLP
jgi:hypothetical protein